MWQICEMLYMWSKWNIDNWFNYGVELITFILLPTPFRVWKLKQIANLIFLILKFFSCCFYILYHFLVCFWYGYNICFCLISHVWNKAINQSINQWWEPDGNLCNGSAYTYGSTWLFKLGKGALQKLEVFKKNWTWGIEVIINGYYDIVGITEIAGREG